MSCTDAAALTRESRGDRGGGHAAGGSQVDGGLDSAGALVQRTRRANIGEIHRRGKSGIAGAQASGRHLLFDRADGGSTFQPAR